MQFQVNVKTSAGTLRAEVVAEDCHKAAFLAPSVIVDLLVKDLGAGRMPRPVFLQHNDDLNDANFSVTVREVRG